MQKSGTGFMTIWSDVTSDQETDYIHWLTREHTEERVSTDGFMGVRVYRALLPDACRYVMCYEFETPAVMSSKAYIDKLNKQSPWTAKTLAILANFRRGGGRVAYETGLGHGGYVTLITLDALPSNHKDIADKLVRVDRISSVRFCETDNSATGIQTDEKKSRAKPDNSYGALLAIEGIDENAIKAALAELRKLAPEIEANSAVGAHTYTTVFILEKRNVGDTHPAHPSKMK
jgi:hypothetical protein